MYNLQDYVHVKTRKTYNKVKFFSRRIAPCRAVNSETTTVIVNENKTYNIQLTRKRKLIFADHVGTHVTWNVTLSVNDHVLLRHLIFDTSNDVRARRVRLLLQEFYVGTLWVCWVFLITKLLKVVCEFICSVLEITIRWHILLFMLLYMSCMNLIFGLVVWTLDEIGYAICNVLSLLFFHSCSFLLSFFRL